jgi:hypothetical protein
MRIDSGLSTINPSWDFAAMWESGFGGTGVNPSTLREHLYVATKVSGVAH